MSLTFPNIHNKEFASVSFLRKEYAFVIVFVMTRTEHYTRRWSFKVKSQNLRILSVRLDRIHYATVVSAVHQSCTEAALLLNSKPSVISYISNFMVFPKLQKTYFYNRYLPYVVASLSAWQQYPIFERMKTASRKLELASSARETLAQD